MVDETEKEHLARHAGRKAAGDKRQKASEERADLSETRADVSEVRADVSEVRADVSEVRADGAQVQQNVTDQITSAHTEQLLVMEEEQTKQHNSFDQIIEGVDLLAIQVGTLNERVYTKTFLDKTRNRLIAFAIIAFVVLSFILTSFLIAILKGNSAESSRAKDRASESAEFRHQLADCQLKPGTVLSDGFVNLGTCYSQNADITGEFLTAAIDRIFNGIRTSQDCIYLRGQGLRPAPCAEVNARVDAFKGGVNPFPPPAPLPGKQTTTTTRAASGSGAPVPPTVVTTVTTTTRTIPATTTTTTNPGLVCSILSLVGLCHA